MFAFLRPLAEMTALGCKNFPSREHQLMVVGSHGSAIARVAVISLTVPEC